MLFTAILWAYLLAALLNRASPLRRGCLIGYRRLASDNAARATHCVAKPAWVRKELVHLKALMPDAGCRAISDVFNRRFAAKRRMTVGKTFVSDVMREHRYEIEVARRHIKNAQPKPLPKNLIWALDLTGKGTLDGRTRLVLGILEHASRAALCLEALESKSSWTLISKLIEAIRRYGKPRAVRTDNEAVFTSRTFGFALTLLGIRHQRTDPGCPWQNGRAERFFGTLKEKLDRLAVDSLEGLNEALVEFRFFYNHVRPHQNLAGLTPSESWTGEAPFTRLSAHEYWFEAWDGLLSGYYWRR
jgi:transposase InsO family protein